MKDRKASGNGEVRADSKGVEFASRRTVVKGLASAVPVVMTLGNGAALAQSSGDCAADTLSATGALDSRGAGILAKGASDLDPYGSDPISFDSPNAIEPTGVMAKGKPDKWFIDSTESLSATAAEPVAVSAGCSFA